MSVPPQVREARVADADACARIYAAYVRDTAITFETEPPDADEMARRITTAQSAHEWLILADGTGVVLGYAYANELKSRAAYRWTVETSVYLDPAHHRGGGGSLLYTELVRRLSSRGYRRVFAGITQPNEASMEFHRRFGFHPCGVFHRVGFKHGRWHDVAWLQLDLPVDGDGTEPPRPISPPGVEVAPDAARQRSGS